jgi:hypothetical protein
VLEAPVADYRYVIPSTPLSIFVRSSGTISWPLSYSSQRATIVVCAFCGVLDAVLFNETDSTYLFYGHPHCRFHLWVRPGPVVVMMTRLKGARPRRRWILLVIVAQAEFSSHS